MNLAELYSLSSGQKIDKIWTFEKYYPGLPEKYIVIQPWSKPSKNYDNWNELLFLILPILRQNNIQLVQVGGKNELPLNGCIHTQGNTNWGQLQYIISKSLLVLCTDSVSGHLAGHYNIPLVDLISNNFSGCVRPYFGDKNKQIILEPDRTKKNPMFALDEGLNKQINEIKPEIIAKSVLSLLNLPFFYPYSTIYSGINYNNKLIESVCDSIVDVKSMGIQALIMRMDINFNLDILARQLIFCPCQIITNKEIPLNFLNQYRAGITDIIYKIDKNHNPKFVKSLIENKIKFQLISELNTEELNNIKLDYIDLGLIFPISQNKPKELENNDLNNIYLKSSKILLGRGNCYQTYYDYLINRPFNPNDIKPEPIIDNNYLSELWKEKDFCLFLKKDNG